MKQAMIFILAVVSAFSAFAKVSNFQSLISENQEQQKQLHRDIETQVQISRELNIKKRVSVVETQIAEMSPDVATYVPRTRAEILRFKKERSAFEASPVKQQDRLANELKQADQEIQ